MRLAVNKKQKYFSLPYHQLAENSFLILAFTKEQKRDKSAFATKFVGIIVTVFSYKNLSEITCKIFATQCFFNDHLKHKTVNKTTCRIPSAKSSPIMCMLVEELSYCYDYFLRLSGFLNLFGKIFLITFKFSSSPELLRACLSKSLTKSAKFEHLLTRFSHGLFLLMEFG